MPESRDEFYVGYLPIPVGHLRFIRITVPVMLWILVVCSTAIVYFQRSPGDAVWDQGKPIQRTGVLCERPYPHVVVEPGDATPVFLVEQGKRGAIVRCQGLDGKVVRITGWKLERDGREIIELAPEAAAIEVLSSEAPSQPTQRDLGEVSLTGEIVDYKCFLGAMKPGDGKSHKACAALCISGGIPPMLVTQDVNGARQYVLLAGSDGGPLATSISELAGEPVRVAGRVREVGALRMLSILPDAIVRTAR